MIVTTEYAIGHIPKTGGDAAKQLFKAAGIEFDNIGSSGDRRKHWSFDEVGVSRPIHVLTFRSLPARELSNNHHGKPPPHAKFYSPDELIELNWSESSLLKRLTRKPVTEWLRSEFLVEDVTAFIIKHHGQCPDLSKVKTKPRQVYDHNIWTFWNKDQVRRLYEASPTWASVERMLYGKLMGE